MSDSSSLRRLRVGQVVPATCVLALLYLGREVLEPLALAAILSLVIAPLKRRIVRFGFSPTAGTFVSVLLVGVCLAWIGAVLGSQLVAVAADLPQYRAAVRTKLERVRELTVRPLERIQAELGGVIPQSPLASPPGPHGRAASSPATPPDQPLAVQIQEPRASASDAVTRLFSTLWGPVGQAGIVLVLLVFMLLEHQSLRDRFIRLAGEAEAGRTMQALEDAGQGVARFFFSQFVVNCCFGTALGLGLWLTGVPHPALWGALGGLARFVPYVGILFSGVVIAAFAAAVDPGWTLVLMSVTVFLVLEVVVAHVVEPQVYGHSTGLAPLGVIVSALFWGALWGPVGLLLSTPMTLCLVVAGRHVHALKPITILFGEAPGVTAGLRFYQRALSGESRQILADARTYLKRRSFARYCDQVLLPGLANALADFRANRIGREQQDRIRAAVATLAEWATAERVGTAARRGRPVPLLDVDVGAHLRQVHEHRMGGQGPLNVPVGSVVLCVGFGSERDDLLTALLVQALCDVGIDAHSVSLAERDTVDAQRSDLVSTVFLVYPLQEQLPHWQAAGQELRAALPRAMLLTVGLPLENAAADEALVVSSVDLVLRSFSEAVAFVLAGRKVAA